MGDSYNVHVNEICLDIVTFPYVSYVYASMCGTGSAARTAIAIASSPFVVEIGFQMFLMTLLAKLLYIRRVEISINHTVICYFRKRTSLAK